MDAAIDEAMECDRIDTDAAHPCGASFGGAAAPPLGWDADSADAESTDEAADNEAMLRQIVHGVGVRQCQWGAQPWWTSAAGGAHAADMMEHSRPGKHPRVAEGVLRPWLGSPAEVFNNRHCSDRRRSRPDRHAHMCCCTVRCCCRAPSIGITQTLCC